MNWNFQVVYDLVVWILLAIIYFKLIWYDS
jgi:hypothetical protein